MLPRLPIGALPGLRMSRPCCTVFYMNNNENLTETTITYGLEVEIDDRCFGPTMYALAVTAPADLGVEDRRALLDGLAEDTVQVACPNLGTYAVAIDLDDEDLQNATLTRI